jgi:membrane protease YdiL (CAAX protease family)
MILSSNAKIALTFLLLLSVAFFPLPHDSLSDAWAPNGFDTAFLYAIEALGIALLGSWVCRQLTNRLAQGRNLAEERNQEVMDLSTWWWALLLMPLVEEVVYRWYIVESGCGPIMATLLFAYVHLDKGAGRARNLSTFLLMTLVGGALFHAYVHGGVAASLMTHIAVNGLAYLSMSWQLVQKPQESLG